MTSDVDTFLLVISTFLDQFGRNAVEKSCTYYCQAIVRFVKVGAVKDIVTYGN